MTEYFTPLDTFTVLIAIGSGYFMGSIPFGLLLAKYFAKIDLRNIGSGNIGATNALRTGNKKVALWTLLCDILKGTLPCLIFHDPVPLAVLAGGGAVLGHIFPIWLRFKGGKGVATFLGTMLALNPLNVLFALMVWGVTVYFSRYSSLGAILAILFTMISTVFFSSWEIFGYVVVFGTLIIAMHHDNITRLLKGSEPKIGQKS